MLEGNHLLIENTRVYDDIMPLMRAVAELEIDGAMTNGGQMLGYFVESCETFISTERQWTGQSWGDPPAEVSCISPQSARCTPFYVVETDTGWAKATWRDALKAHLNDKRWDTALEETAESFKQRCERNSLADRGCPGYAEAKAEQDRMEAEREKERQRLAAEKEKERQKELAQQRKREEEQRKREEEERRRLYELANKPLTKQTLKRGITYKWYHDGSCTQSDTELCVSKQNYEFLCREARKSEAITRSAIGLAGSYSDRIWSFLANNGRLRAIEISSGDRGNYSCHVTIEMVGIYEGSQYIKRQSASVTSFVINNDNEVMITSTSSYHW